MTAQRDYLSLGVLVVFLCLLVGGAALSFQKTRTLPPATCTLDLQGQPLAEADQGLPAPGFEALGIVSLIGGHLFGRLRNRIGFRGPRAFSTENRAIFTAVLAIVFLGVFVALFYEALGVLRVPQGTILQPLTYYVRCAIHYDMHPNPAVPAETQFPLFSVVLVVSFCFLFGHWMWYPRSQSR